MARTILWSLCLVIVLLGTTSKFNAQSDDSEVNCAVFPDQIIGQANISYAGAANISYAGALGDEIQTNDWDIEETTVLNDLQYEVAGDENVAIVIVDDFSSVDPREDDADTVDWTNASHGWLVVEVFERIINTLPSSTASLMTVETLDLGGDNEYRSDLIALELATLLDDLHTNAGIDKFVVNMSFVFVACEDGGFNHAEWLVRRESDPDLTLVEETGGDLEYVESALSDARVTNIDENGFDIDNSQAGPGSPPQYIVQNLQFLSLFEISRMNNDPLRSFFMDSHPYTIVPIASAGNFKWKRPFFPAQWSEVLSVSATLGNSNDLWALSNNGEVSAPGAYFRFSDDIYRAGTSFAAPVVSVMTALDLTRSNPTCTVANNGRPELGSHGRWNDVPLLEAVFQRC